MLGSMSLMSTTLKLKGLGLTHKAQDVNELKSQEAQWNILVCTKVLNTHPYFQLFRLPPNVSKPCSSSYHFTAYTQALLITP